MWFIMYNLIYYYIYHYSKPVILKLYNCSIVIILLSYLLHNDIISDYFHFIKCYGFTSLKKKKDNIKIHLESLIFQVYAAKKK